jgi:glutamine amidotransferase
VLAVVDYGIGNLRSAQKALEHLGADARLATEPAAVDAASGVVLPGVGSFGRCAEALAATGLDTAVRRALADGRPFLGICVGFQLLYDGSEEAPGVPGLGVLSGMVRALPAGVKRPQMQWNRIEPWPGGTGPDADTPWRGPLFEGLGAAPWVYFVHSYAPELTDAAVAVCDYGGPVVAAAGEGAVWGTQFHPEKSGRAGLAVLANFVRACEED